MEEIWKQIEGGYEEYQVSNFGQIKSLKSKNEKIPHLDKLQQYIAEKLDSSEKAEKIINIIDNNWSFFAEETAVLVEVESYDCLTIVDEDDNVNEIVCPFDENRIYPMQRIEQKLYFNR